MGKARNGGSEGLFLVSIEVNTVKFGFSKNFLSQIHIICFHGCVG
jgi:hypothetical protein